VSADDLRDVGGPAAPAELGDIVVRIPIAAGAHPYEVLLGPGVLDNVGPVTASATGAGRVALVTDDVVGARYADRVAASLSRAGISSFVVRVAPGESSKDWAVAGRVLESLSEHGLDRTGAVVALGGGVVGDLAGFCAAVYLRGVPFVQVPTTLLAQVDSSVGGKTGVDLPQGKNLVGAFWQPSAVLADTTTLATLPVEQWTSGLAEVAKGAFTDSERFVAVVERASEAGVVPRDGAETRGLIAEAIAFKVRVVATDEREQGEREVLNYGHTFGHALEKVLGYGTLTHGAAVAEGIRFAALLAEEAVASPASWTARQGNLLGKLGLGEVASDAPARMLAAATPEVLLDAMKSDKKARGGTIRFVLSRGPGQWEARPVADDIALRHLRAWSARAAGGSAAHERGGRP
jgi:3-dehydroquinate synthase